MTILVTGSGGRVGHRLLTILANTPFKVKALARSYKPHLEQADDYILENLSPNSNFDDLLKDVDTVIHLADGFNAYEQVPPDHKDPEAQSRLKTLENLSHATAQKNIRLIYLSTIKSLCGAFAKEVLTENTKPRPQSLYGVLKRTSEDIILKNAKKHGSTAIILRFPIVFGSDIGGNIERLISLANMPFPLPLKGLQNKRSLISADSLIDAVLTILQSDIAGSHNFLLHDGSLTIAEILSVITQDSKQKTVKLFPLPTAFWSLLEIMPVIGSKAERFTKPLELDDSKFRKRFDWKPPIDLKISLRQTAKNLKK